MWWWSVLYRVLCLSLGHRVLSVCVALTSGVTMGGCPSTDTTITQAVSLGATPERQGQGDVQQCLNEIEGEAMRERRAWPVVRERKHVGVVVVLVLVGGGGARGLSILQG